MVGKTRGIIEKVQINNTEACLTKLISGIGT